MEPEGQLMLFFLWMMLFPLIVWATMTDHSTTGLIIFYGMVCTIAGILTTASWITGDREKFWSALVTTAVAYVVVRALPYNVIVF